MEKVLNDQIVKQIEEAFAEVKEPVQVLFFGSKDNCDYCNEAKRVRLYINTAAYLAVCIYIIKKT